MNLSILGGGKWGTALAVLYSHKYDSEEIGLWMYPEKMDDCSSLVDCVKASRQNPSIFPDIC